MTTVQIPPRHAAPSGPPPRTVWLIGGMIALAVVVLAVVAVVVYRTGPQNPADARDHVVSAPAAGRDAAVLDLLSGATAVTVKAADLGDRLFEAETPRDGRLAPRAKVTDDGVVQLTLDGDSGGPGGAAVEVRLNRGVRWTVRFTAGANASTADLRDLGNLAAVEYVGGVAAVDLTLPAAHGTVPVRLSGGANTVALHAPKGTPVRVRAGGGAGAVTLDGAGNNGVAAGATFASAGWDAAADRYDLDATSGVGTITVDHM
ncbi:hypothetical protein ACFFX1_02870 [Dactylosporangium sucinum]|uniref:Adhesin domain-containing protein n=1 Tax=Dactylosporangium sucinum TaxID=1424081 RepID=A0A917X4M2_9ACTN|nr:hypothetical protein [Dactylosporangium sucinum]GGM65284.1 hypothetical protein GCM10007977_078510 [Dactylosporangium sucinum]